MGTVTMMLSSETFPLPQPKTPGFIIFGRWKHLDSGSSVGLLEDRRNGVAHIRGDVY